MLILAGVAAILRIGLLEMSSFTLEFFPSSSPETFSHHSAGLADLITSQSSPFFLENDSDEIVNSSILRRTKQKGRPSFRRIRKDVRRTGRRTPQRTEITRNDHVERNLYFPPRSRTTRRIPLIREGVPYLLRGNGSEGDVCRSLIPFSLRLFNQKVFYRFGAFLASQRKDPLVHSSFIISYIDKLIINRLHILKA